MNYPALIANCWWKQLETFGKPQVSKFQLNMEGKKLANPYYITTEVHMNPIPTVIKVAHSKSSDGQKDCLLAEGLPTVLQSYWQKDYLLYFSPTDRRITYCNAILLAVGLPSVLQSY